MMKVFISADIEGTAGISHWDETEKRHPDYTEYRELMTAEVVAACDGARAAGATEIVVKDAHDTGRNLIVGALPADVTVIRGWSGHPDEMMFGIGRDFGAAIYTGYHSKAGTEANPLAHTSNRRISRLLFNGEVASEFTFNALCAASYGVPSALIAGDKGICAEARAMIPGIATVETMEGVGRSTISVTPARAQALIREGVEAALRRNLQAQIPVMPRQFEVVVEFNNPVDAYRTSWYPGVRSHGPRAIAFSARDYFEILRALLFIKG